MPCQHSRAAGRQSSRLRKVGPAGQGRLLFGAHAAEHGQGDAHAFAGLVTDSGHRASERCVASVLPSGSTAIAVSVSCAFIADRPPESRTWSPAARS